MIYASTFLSYSSVDSPLVQSVARELGRRGIRVWLDKNELGPGTDMVEQLREAIKKQTTVTLFLSEAALASKWVEEELNAAIEIEKESGAKQRVIPVFIGDVKHLVASHRLLNSRWMHPDGNRVSRKGIIVDTEQEPHVAAKQIAVQLARSIYQLLEMEKKDDLVIYLDQRGEGLRCGEPPNVPDNINDLNIPALVFRMDQGERKPGETLHGKTWEEIRDVMREGLSTALGMLRGPTPRKVRLLGNSQLAFPFLIGWHCNRNTNVSLYCNNMTGHVFSNDGQERSIPLRGGNPKCEGKHPLISTITPGKKREAFALLLGTELLVEPVLGHIREMPVQVPLKWVKSDHFETSEEVMEYIANVVALLGRLRTEHGMRKVYLYCGLPFHMVPLLAANLLNVVETIIFMEYRRDFHHMNVPQNMTYTPLLMA